MLTPVSPYDELPSDVAQFADSLRDSVAAPTVFADRLNLDRRPILTTHISPSSRPFDDVISNDWGLSEAAGPGGPSVVQEQPPKLDHWTIQAHVYTKEIAARFGLLIGLFGATGKTASAGAMNEAKRFRLAKTEAGTEVEVGVAVRLHVATTNWEVEADISIPNIAAAAQLKLTTGDARIGIEVTGYSGPLGDLLPAPRQLDVTSLADYLVAFAKIQAAVFGDTGLPFLTPTVLSVDRSAATEAAGART